MKLDHLKITRRQLKKIPEDERAMFIGLAHFANETNALNKLLFWTSNAPFNHPVEKKAVSFQALVILRVFAGKLYEGWRLIDQGYIKSRLKEEYNDALLPESRDAFGKLEDYFNNRHNRIKTVRHKYANHYDLLKLKDCLDDVPDEEALDFYLHKIQANTFYYGAELAVTYSLLNDIRKDGNHDQAFKDIFKDITQVYGWFADFVGGWLIIVTKKYLDENFSKLRPVKPKIKTHPPHIDDIKLTFFVANKPPR